MISIRKTDLNNALDYSTHEILLFSFIKFIVEKFELGNCYLFRYSPFDHTVEGILSLQQDSLEYIPHIRDDLSTIPEMFQAIEDLEAKLYLGFSFQTIGIKKYPKTEHDKALFIIPISIKKVPIGYLCSSQFKKNPVDFTEKMLDEATLLGENFGEILYEYNNKSKESLLSSRELMTMKYIADGYSTKEIAQLLYLSESTIKQYVKQSVIKLNAKNRVHAISLLYQRHYL